MVAAAISREALSECPVDAFGILIHTRGTMPNNSLYCGERPDPGLGLYYKRAPLVAMSTATFWNLATATR